jgi:hypothetical protein
MSHINIMYKFDYNSQDIPQELNEKDKFNKKLKFANLDTIDRNNPELIMKQKSEFIQHENFLIFPKELIDKKPRCFNNFDFAKRKENTADEYVLPIDDRNLEDKTKLPIIRIDGVDVGAGRGFGNLNVSNDIRNGEDSRLQNHKFKKIKEAEVIDRFEFLDKDIQNPHNLILPFPRGGEITRKKPIIKKELDNKNFSFNYNE